MAAAVPLLPLHDGEQIPAVGLGTWPLDDDGAEASVAAALEMGYRLVDTASRYGNERGVGRALRAAGVPREHIFLTTKLRGLHQGRDRVRRGFEESLERLGLDYVDLYLIHWPLPGRDEYVESWQVMTQLRDEGLIRSLGVSNFNPDHIDRLVAETDVVPVANQIEMHPDFPQKKLREYHASRGILTQAWSPLGRAGEVLSDPTVHDIARRLGVTAGQVVLRWHIEMGAVPIPKSSNPQRMAANLAVFDFSLSPEDLSALASLDRGNRLGGDPAVYVEE